MKSKYLIPPEKKRQTETDRHTESERSSLILLIYCLNFQIKFHTPFSAIHCKLFLFLLLFQKFFFLFFLPALLRYNWQINIAYNGFPGSSVDKELAYKGFLSWVGRIPGRRALQHSSMKNPMDRGVWWATVHGVTESDTTEWLGSACVMIWYMHILWKDHHNKVN